MNPSTGRSLITPTGGGGLGYYVVQNSSHLTGLPNGHFVNGAESLGARGAATTNAATTANNPVSAAAAINSSRIISHHTNSSSISNNISNNSISLSKSVNNILNCSTNSSVGGPSSSNNITLLAPGSARVLAANHGNGPPAIALATAGSANINGQQQLAHGSNNSHLSSNLNGFSAEAQQQQPPTSTIVKEEIDTEAVIKTEDETPEMDIFINNVVCSFSVRCHLNLKEIALNGSNVEYRRENGMVTMKLRRPCTTASIWSSGKITCTGANTEDEARLAARRFSRILQKLDDKYKNIRIKNWRIVNVLGTCNLPFGIKIVPFSQAFKEASYEPELHPGVTYKLKYPKATLKIFSTGSITVTAPSVANVQAAVEHIYPKVCEYQKPKDPADIKMDSLRGVKRKHWSTVSNGHKASNNHQELDDNNDDDDDEYANGDSDEEGEGSSISPPGNVPPQRPMIPAKEYLMKHLPGTLPLGAIMGKYRREAERQNLSFK